MAVELTAAQARKLGLDLTGARKAPVRTTRRVAKGAYHTVCHDCGEEFHTSAAEDRHLENTKHARYQLVLGYSTHDGKEPHDHHPNRPAPAGHAQQDEAPAP